MRTIRVTRKTARLLDLMLDARRFNVPTTAAMVMKKKVGPGSFYPLIIRLEGAGWVYSEWKELPEGAERPRRRFYYLTEDGARWAHEAVKEYDALPPWWMRVGGKR